MSSLKTNEPLSVISGWQEWKTFWEQTPIAECRHSLLHWGFAVRTQSQEEFFDRILFYFDVADGWIYSSNFKIADEEDWCSQWTPLMEEEKLNPQPLSSVRRILAEKAFRELCKNFFKEKDKYVQQRIDSIEETRWFAKLNFGILEKVLWFFRYEDHRIRNMPYDGEVYARIAERFLFNLCRLAFENTEPDWRTENNEIKARLREAQPQMVEFLLGLGKEDHLLQYNLNDACLKKLEEIALGGRLNLPTMTGYGREYRSPKTVEEACLGESRATRILLTLRVIKKEQKRIEIIREVEEKVKIAQQQLKQLEG